MLVKILDRYFAKKLLQKYKTKCKEMELDLGYYIRRGELILFIKPKSYKERYYREVNSYKITDCFEKIIDKNLDKEINKSIKDTLKIFQLM